jgi:hypothetical protein
MNAPRKPDRRGSEKREQNAPVDPGLNVFFRKPLERLRTYLQPSMLPLGLGAVTLLLGLVGWTGFAYDGTFHSMAYILFRTLGNLVPSVWNINSGNLLTDIAAVIGLLTFYASLAIVGTAYLTERWRKLAARFIYKNHVLVIGDTPLAWRAAAIWRRHDKRTLHVCNDRTGSSASQPGTIRHPLDISLIEGLSLHDTRNVFLDLGDDILSLALSLQLLDALAADAKLRKSSLSSQSEWVIVVGDRALADHFALKVADLVANMQNGRTLPHIHYLYPERLAVRFLLAQKPLFVEAKINNQERIHALVLSYGPIGSHLIETIFLGSLVTDQGRPRVTVLSRQPDVDRNAFFSERPALENQIDVSFLDLAALSDFEHGDADAARALRAREESAPITAAFFISENAQENMRLAILVKRIHRRTGRFPVQLFGWAEDDEELGRARTADAFGQVIEGYSAFGLNDDFLEAQLCDPDRRDRLARALHTKYLMTNRRDGPTWSDLPESLRRANCNAADHCSAKLFSLGFDITAIPAGSIPHVSEADAKALLVSSAPGRVDAGHDPLSAVVRLEHERWTIERFLDGWTHAETYDRVRQTHPLLVSWEILLERHPEQVLMNRKQVEALLECLLESTDGVALNAPLRVPPRPISQQQAAVNVPGILL